MHIVVNGPASWNTLVRLDALPEPRPHTVFATAHHDGLGGTSAGKAVTLAALGAEVTLATVLGDDEEAARVRSALDHPGLTVLAAPAVAGRTERHVNLTAPDGGRLSIYLELPRAEGEPAPEVLAALSTADAAVLDLADSSLPLLAAARAAGTPVWCDVHDDDGVSAYQRPFAAAADVLLVSDVRLADPEAYLDAAVARGCTLAVCTRGSRGALARDADGWWEVGAAAVEAVDADGAGDAFLAGLLRATLAGLPREVALAQAAATGALAVQTTALGAPHADVEAVERLAGTVAVARR